MAAWKACEVTFKIYGQELRSVETFKSVGCPMSCTDGNLAGGGISKHLPCPQEVGNV